MFHRKMPDPSPLTHTLRSFGVTQPNPRREGSHGARNRRVPAGSHATARCQGRRTGRLDERTGPGHRRGVPGGDQEAAAVEAAELARLAAEQHAFAAGADAGEAGDGDGADPPVEDLIISNRDSYHVLRFVPTSFDSSVCLHLWLARAEGNLALARIRLGEMAGRLVLG
ncbi:hypothetical protein SALBM311S_08966 [Streptomyces alboniger]